MKVRPPANGSRASASEDQHEDGGDAQQHAHRRESERDAFVERGVLAARERLLHSALAEDAADHLALAAGPQVAAIA